MVSVIADEVERDVETLGNSLFCDDFEDNVMPFGGQKISQPRKEM